MNQTFDFDKIRIASPCKMNWNEMSGDERKRHCAECQLSVFNVEGMSREEATALILSASKSGSRLCLRLARREDGKILTRDCPVGQKLIARMRLRMASLAVAVAGLLWFTGIKTARAQRTMGEVAAPTHLMGKIALPRPDVRTSPETTTGPEGQPEAQPEAAPKPTPDPHEEEPYVFNPDEE